MTGLDYAALVEAALARYFPDPDDLALARLLLAEYGREPHHREPLRVRAAMLKLAGASLQQLEQQLATARQDHRDVLAAAEYPRQMTEGVRAAGDPAAHSRWVREDRAQYRNWVESFGLDC